MTSEKMLQHLRKVHEANRGVKRPRKSNIPIKICKRCGKEYQKRNKDYCSKKCSTSSLGKSNCGKKRLPSLNKILFWALRQLETNLIVNESKKRSTIPIKICKYCGIEYQKRNKDYCSSACRGAANSEKSKTRWADPIYRQHITEEINKRCTDPVYLKKLSLSVKEIVSTPEKRKQNSDRRIKYYVDNPDAREIVSKNTKKQWENPEFKTLKIKQATEQMANPDNRKYLSILATKQWKNPEFAKSISEQVQKHWDDHPELRQQRSEQLKGENSPTWKGGITPLHERIRRCTKYYEWRLAIFERDNYSDWLSGVKGNGNLNAHHIIPFSQLLEENNIRSLEEALACKALWDINNGVTMIDTNHVAYHSIYL